MSDRSPRPAHGPVQDHSGTVSADAPSIVCYSILAQADPGVMPRVLELFAKRNLVPLRWHSDVLSGPRRDLAIDLQVAGLSPALGDYIGRCLRQIPGVATVLIAEKHPSAGRVPGALSA